MKTNRIKEKAFPNTVFEISTHNEIRDTGKNLGGLE
jgi:hypothetical protein